MKMRSAKTKKKGQRAHGDSSTSTSLDEDLWGTLQHHIDLAENVYSKLPFEEFFQLRTVCRDWYMIACKRLGLKEPIHKPFFTLFTQDRGRQLHGILTYNALSRSWNWRPNWNHYSDFAASKGVAFSVDDNPLVNSAYIFYWQSKVLQTLTLPLTRPNTSENMILGMIVSEKQGLFGSFSSFRFVRGSWDFDTQVYESGVWQTKPCRVPKPEAGGPLMASTGCADCNGRVYISTEHSREIFVYDFEKSSWSSLLGPCDWVSKLLPQHCRLNTLGAWNGRVFNATSDFQSGRRKKKWFFQVWELVDEMQHKWKVYDRMPKGLCSWLRTSTGFRPFTSKAADISLQASFCGDFMLVYSWDYRYGWAGRFSLFNMATKNWQKLNIAAGMVAIREIPSADSEDSDNSFTFDAYGNESSLDEFMMGDDGDDMDSDSDSDFFFP